MEVIIRILLTNLFLIFLLLISLHEIFGQTQCFSPQEAEKVINLINSSPHNAAPNPAIHDELLQMQADQEKTEQKVVDNRQENRQLIENANDSGEKHLLRLCEIIKQNGWLTKELVGDDGAEAAASIIRSNRNLELEREIFPIVVAAAKKGLIGNEQVAWLIDSIRASSGRTQIFGTQIKIKDGIFYLYPLENDAKTDEWRKLYNLPPLSEFIKYLQTKYQMVVVESPRSPVLTQAKEKKATATAATDALNNPLVDLEQDEVVKVESSLVNLNVRVSAADSANAANLDLQKSDFAVYEDGKKQDIAFFSTTDAPFDLVLLLDLSGSTADKKDLIRKSTRQFIEAARPTDRIAIVTFTDEAKIVSDLTENREDLLKSVKKINDSGGSAVWGSLEFVLDKIIKPESKAGRRTAILMMTDGVDTSLLYSSNAASPLFAVSAMPASYPTFTHLLETVRAGDTTIIPIYLDTEAQSYSWEAQAYRTARKTLEMLAEETGGEMYNAKKISDLNGIYEKIIEDLGKIYSLGYQPPADDKRDGSWHSLSVKIPNHPNLIVRSKQGYYSK